MFVGINSCRGATIRPGNEESHRKMDETRHCSNHLDIHGDKTPWRSSEGREQCLGEGGLTATTKIVSTPLVSMQLTMAINYLGCYSNNKRKKIFSATEIASEDLTGPHRFPMQDRGTLRDCKTKAPLGAMGSCSLVLPALSPSPLLGTCPEDLACDPKIIPGEWLSPNPPSIFMLVAPMACPRRAHIGSMLL